MSVYDNVNKLADYIARRHESFSSFGCNDSVSRCYPIKQKRSVIRRQIWERLLKSRFLPVKSAFSLSQIEYSDSSACVFDLYLKTHISHEKFIQIFDIVHKLPEVGESHSVLAFLFIMSELNVTRYSEMSPNPIPTWRFQPEKKWGDQRIGHPLSRELTPKIDWSLAEKFPGDVAYSTWESRKFDFKGNCERSALDSHFDYWHRSRALMSSSCFSCDSGCLSACDTIRDVTFHEIISACCSLLLGCMSRVFEIRQSLHRFSLQNDIYVSGISHDALVSFTESLTFVAESFRGLTDFVSSLEQSKNELPFSTNWLCHAVRDLLHRYMGRVILLSDKTCSSDQADCFMSFVRSVDSIATDVVDIVQLWHTIKRIQALPNSSSPWQILGFLFEEALRCSWLVNSEKLFSSLILEQYLFAEVSGPLFNRLSLAAFTGFSASKTQLSSFGIILRTEVLIKRDLSYWLEGFELKAELLRHYAPGLFFAIEALIATGRCVEFLKICKPNHFLLHLFDSLASSLPCIKFIPANEYQHRELYLANHEVFKNEIEHVRLSSRRYVEELRLLIVRAVSDKLEALSEQLRARDDALEAHRLMQQKLKHEKKLKLRDEQLAETAAKRAAKALAKQQEQEHDRALVERLAQETFMRTDFERRLAEEERKRLLDYYLELEKQADWRRAKAKWRSERFGLAEKRLEFFSQDAKEIPMPKDSIIVAESAPAIVRPPVLDFELKDEHTQESLVENRESVVVAPSIVIEDAPIVSNSVTDDIAPTERASTPADEPLVPSGSIIKSPTTVAILNNSGEEEVVEIISGRALLSILTPENCDGAREERRSSLSPEPSTHEDEIFKDEKPATTTIVERNENEVDDNHIELFKPRAVSQENFKLLPLSTLTNFKDYAAPGPKQVNGSSDDCQIYTFSELFDICVLRPSHTLSEVLNLAVVEYLRDELDIIGHLLALRRYLLLDAGEFAIAISLPIFAALNSDKSTQNEVSDSITQFFLETTLKNAVRYVGSPISHMLAEERSRANYGEAVLFLQQDFTDKLEIRRSEAQPFNPAKPFCFDSLELSYKIGWPLNIVLPPEDMVVYSKVFSFLLEIYRVVNLLDSYLQVLDDCQDVIKRQSPIVDVSLAMAALRQAHHARCLMRFFFTSIQTYLTSHVLRQQWEQLLTEVESAKSLDEIRKAHNAYLENLRKRCFLTESTRPFRAILSRLIKCVLEFDAEMKTIADNIINGSGPVKRANIAKIQTASEDFRANSRHFVSVAAARVAQFDRLGFLDRLLLQLTFNDYYACDNVSQHKTPNFA